RERGVTRFRAEVLPENTAMRQLCHTLDPEAAERSDGESVVVTLTLPEVAATEAPSAEVGRGPIYRLLRLVAERLITIRRALDSLVGLDHGNEAREAPAPEPPAPHPAPQSPGPEPPGLESPNQATPRGSSE